VHTTRLVLGPRELRAVLYLPSWYRPGRDRLPVLAAPYGGAGLQLVTAELDYRSLMPQWFAEQGFAVLVADGSGTPGRGPRWEREVHHAYWRERFLGHPDQFPERYEAASLVRAAPKLTRPLLLIHGLADTNVWPANTLRLSSALLAAGRPHEVLPLPGAGHQVAETETAEQLLWHQVRFLQRHLRVDPPA
jgi:dipeptidyl aminopeptidase/acylaminoacyl peptidase